MPLNTEEFNEFLPDGDTGTDSSVGSPQRSIYAKQRDLKSSTRLEDSSSRSRLDESSSSLGTRISVGRRSPGNRGSNHHGPKREISSKSSMSRRMNEHGGSPMNDSSSRSSNRFNHRSPRRAISSKSLSSRRTIINESCGSSMNDSSSRSRRSNVSPRRAVSTGRSTASRNMMKSKRADMLLDESVTLEDLSMSSFSGLDFGGSFLNDSSRMNDSSTSLTRSARSRKANLSPKRGKGFSSSRSNTGTVNTSSNTTDLFSGGDATKSVTIEEQLDESISSVGVDLGRSFQKDSSKETQSTLRLDDETDEDLKMLEDMMKSNADLRLADSKASLTIGDLRNDSSCDKQEEEKERKRPSILNHFKGMYSSYPGHLTNPPPCGMEAGNRSYRNQQLSSSSFLDSGNSRRVGQKHNKRRSSLFEAAQEFFQGGTMTPEEELVDVTVDEEKPLKVTGLERSGGSGKSIITARRTMVLSCNLLFVCLVVSAIFIWVLQFRKDAKNDSAQSANQDEKRNPIPIFSSKDNITDPRTSQIQESPLLQSHQELDTSKVPASSRSEVFAFLIRDQNISTSEDLQLLDSPQALAFRWISQNDPAQRGIPDSEESLRALLQRYALAVFYFSHEAVAVTIDNTEISRQARSDMNLKWTSALHECKWTGVFCNRDSMVTAVNLSSSLLQGSLPKELLSGAAFPALTSLDLSHNHLSGELPFVHHTFSASVVGTTPGMIPLQQLRLNNNHIKGWMDSLMVLDELQHLNLRSNRIDGTMPPMVSSLTKLTNLNVGNNFMHGNISSVESLTNLEILQLDGNGFNGTIPIQLATLTSLKELKLGHNEELSGQISSLPWGQLSKLKSLDLRETHVTGTIPPSLGQTSLESLHMHGTALFGTMPQEICQLRAPQGPLRELTSDCDELGKVTSVTCECCSDCFWG